MDMYNKFLAENVLSEGKVVTYRLLSRALQVHVNTAKQMLYDFHRSQNAKRPGAVHATYLVYGIKKAVDGPLTTQNGGDGDVDMTSSAPEVESLTETVPTFTLSLAPEEKLQDMLASFEAVTSIYVYSIGAHPTTDLALLTDAANDALTLDAPNYQKDFGPVINPRVRRRERQGAGLKAAAAASSAATNPPTKVAFPKAAQAPASVKVKEEPQAAQPAQEAAEKTSSGPTKKAASHLKRGASSGIMQAFSKAASKPTKPKKETGTPQTATPSGEDLSIQPMSDDGEDDEELPQPKPRNISGTKSKKEREEELRRMMEEDQDEEEEEASEKGDSPAEEAMEEEAPAPPEPAKEEEAEVVTASSNGRRRGKRRVMRKKQIMDEQGYLVTIQEPGWESFSEDELLPPTKPKTTNSAPPMQAGKPKKGSQKGGQGSIMSFFAKK